MTRRRNVIYLPPSPEYPSLVADVRADGKILFATPRPRARIPKNSPHGSPRTRKRSRLGYAARRPTRAMS